MEIKLNINLEFVMLFWVYIHTGQAEKYASRRWKSNLWKIKMMTHEDGNGI